MRSAHNAGRSRNASGNTSEDGFLLLGAIVAVALVMLIVAIAAPRVARSLRRDRELETVHRGEQYVRAIQLYYRKFGHYPGNIDQLEHSNNIRFLRQRYVDPLTGKDDFTIIPVGRNKTTVKTFFGQPIAGLPAAGAGSASTGTSSPGGGQPAAASGSGAAGFGGSSSSGFGGSSIGGFGPSGGFGGTPSTAAPGAAATTGGPASAAATASIAATGGGLASQPATTFSGTGQPFMGVSLGAHGDSIIEYNQQTTFESWEFLYDPRLDQLKAKAAALNGGPGSTPAGSLGSGFGQTGTTGVTGGSGSPGSTPAAAPSAIPTAPGTPPTTTPPSTTPPTTPPPAPPQP